MKKSTKVCIINVDIIDMVISTIIVNTMYILFLIILYKFTYGSKKQTVFYFSMPLEVSVSVATKISY